MIALRRDCGKFLCEPDSIYCRMRALLQMKQTTIPAVFWADDHPELPHGYHLVIHGFHVYCRICGCIAACSTVQVILDMYSTVLYCTVPYCGMCSLKMELPEAPEREEEVRDQGTASGELRAPRHLPPLSLPRLLSFYNCLAHGGRQMLTDGERKRLKGAWKRLDEEQPKRQRIPRLCAEDPSLKDVPHLHVASPAQNPERMRATSVGRPGLSS